MAEVIAERVFYIEDPKKPVLTLRVFKPSAPENDYPRCSYELVGPRYEKKGEATGVDAVDSILRCMELLGSTVAGLNESIFGGRLRWEGWPEGGRGLGLPTIEDRVFLRQAQEGGNNRG